MSAAAPRPSIRRLFTEKDLDTPSPIHEGRAKMGPDQILLGNLNPVTVLFPGRRIAKGYAWTDVHQQEVGSSRFAARSR